VLELAAAAWATVAVLYWLFAAAASEGSVVAGVLFGAAIAGILVFGCWKVRSGANGWRVFFTIISGCYGILVPFGFLDPEWGLELKAFSVVIGALGITGLVCSWLPASNRYFHDAAEHRRAVNAQRFAEFIRNNPPPESVRRKMFPNQPPPPPGAPPNWNQPPNGG
jgi:hypothetical protein